MNKFEMTLLQRIGFYVREPRYDIAVFCVEFIVCSALLFGCIEALCVLVPIALGL